MLIVSLPHCPPNPAPSSSFWPNHVLKKFMDARKKVIYFFLSNFAPKIHLRTICSRAHDHFNSLLLIFTPYFYSAYLWAGK